MISKAIEFAKAAHNGQIRKFTNEPYITHPLRVSDKIKTLTQNNTLTIAAILHDTLEDTQATENQIENLFGEQIKNLVIELTSNKEKIKQTNKQNYLANKMKNSMSKEALIIKLADRLDNQAIG